MYGFALFTQPTAPRPLHRGAAAYRMQPEAREELANEPGRGGEVVQPQRGGKVCPSDHARD